VTFYDIVEFNVDFFSSQQDPREKDLMFQIMSNNIRRRRTSRRTALEICVLVFINFLQVLIVKFSN